MGESGLRRYLRAVAAVSFAALAAACAGGRHEAPVIMKGTAQDQIEAAPIAPTQPRPKLASPKPPPTGPGKRVVVRPGQSVGYLAREYGVPWSARLLRDLGSILGAGIMLRIASSYGIRQAAKLVPVVGQTVGGAASSAIAFATTYALGRATCVYLHARAGGGRPDPGEVRRVYAEAMKGARHGPRP